MEKNIDQLGYIRDEMLTSPDIEALTVWNAARLAEEDQYLYDLMIDWAKETDNSLKSEMLKEVIDYTNEILRKFNR